MTIAHERDRNVRPLAGLLVSSFVVCRCARIDLRIVIYDGYSPLHLSRGHRTVFGNPVLTGNRLDAVTIVAVDNLEVAFDVSFVEQAAPDVQMSADRLRNLV